MNPKDKITIEEVKKIAQLAHINVDDMEAEKYAKQIGDILAYVEKLKEVDTEGYEFKSQTDLINVFREDIPEPSLEQKEVVKNRQKKSKGGSLVIKSVL
ncbi:MAG: Aspartyl/glutamyl-tRNA(Asn/Gln) amidotransferase subunit C [candidate division WS6 bacterium GW2011_GWF2_39_15]|uniref:Aspartyl/glutamyl-tRNA(Asn/Gln) amidotransferase subunit C n=1 Tax=candidate division WS6 bacterium GW2011_GWF2_39_15 TaxID=1619100 RepID=A0A0G0Q6K6_9BACT|nr:MAG: Aspartyl/glutamyl-tRNA(Asn/Gln) amidotransferase subunit C [candidate division WS6 bacterium GW2011_GWF2_39_15]